MTPPQLERFTFVLLRRPPDAPDLPEAEWTEKGGVSFAR
jgi:hypothetical protein